MLPDLPEYKRQFNEVIRKFISHRAREKMGVFNDSPRHIIHEGEEMHIQRADGSADASPLKTASAEVSIQFDDIPRMTAHDLMVKVELIAESMAAQMSKHLFETLNETLDKAGQVTNANGRPFGPETLLEGLESLQIDFDPSSGSASNLSVVVGPDLLVQAQEAYRQLASDPALRARYEELMNKKREEWRDREAARKLVG